MGKIKIIGGIEYVERPTKDNIGCAVWGCEEPFYKTSPVSKGTPIALCKKHYLSY